jgi:two-component system response regulator MprA
MATVLLIADDDWVRNDVEAALSGPRRAIRTVADPREAVQAAADAEPDAIVIDMQVGSMGGMAVVRACKDAIAAGLIGEAPLVLLLDRSADAFLADRSGADAWVTKPFTAQELRAVIPTGSSV